MERMFIIGLLVVTLGDVAAAAPGRLLRYPDLHGDRVVFTYAGDLWLVAAGGGAARRLTSHPGLERFAKFSPDGRALAFTAQYDGHDNVYLLRLDDTGAAPRQLTFHPGGAPLENRLGVHNQVIGWSRDGKRVLFLSRRDAGDDWTRRLYAVDAGGGPAEPLPLPESGLAAFDAGGTRVAYNRLFRNFDGWKRYRGGQAQDIVIYDLAAGRLEQRLPHTNDTDTFPLWRGDTIYFASDRGPEHRLNLHRFRPSGRGLVEQLTRFAEFDVRWPSLDAAGGAALVFENGGWLYRYDLESGQASQIHVEVPPPEALVAPRTVDVRPLVSDFDLGPDGREAVFAARGALFTVDARGGAARLLTYRPGARDRDAAWSPDGRSVAFVSDRDGEDELYLASRDGSVEALTRGHHGFMSAPLWSPDGRKLAWSDETLQLWYLDLGERRPVAVDRGRYSEIAHYAWSADGSTLAYDKQSENGLWAVYCYSLASGRGRQASDPFTSSYWPIFVRNELYFLSDRDFNPVLDKYDFEYVNIKTTRIYRATPGEAGERRAEPLPMTPANITGLAVAGGIIYYSTAPVTGLGGPLGGEPAALRAFDLGAQADRLVLTGVGRWRLARDGATVLYRGDDGAYQAQGLRPSRRAARAPAAGSHKLDLAGLRLGIDPRAEWRQMFAEARRRVRDFFFDAGTGGHDWRAIGDQYAPLLGHVATRDDLTFVLQEMLGELSTSHDYVDGGDGGELRGAPVGLLGADLALDRARGLYRFARIYRGASWAPGVRAPLGATDVAAGEYLLAVDGRALRPTEDPYAALVGRAGRPVTLTVSASPGGAARAVRVVPVADERQLRRVESVDANRRAVERASDGRVGYIEVTDMEARGLADFAAQFLAQVRKQGLIIDVRYNPGGDVDQLLFERLRRQLVGMKAGRHRAAITSPPVVFHGHLAALANGYTASNGDSFAHYFKVYRLGPVIGTRTWGGVRGPRDLMPLVDGGYLTMAEQARYDLEGRWIIENHGVDPDIEVDNAPDEVSRGRDPQLERAVQYLMQRIAAAPPTLPSPPPPPPPGG